jgi:hypothetical protein
MSPVETGNYTASTITRSASVVGGEDEPTYRSLSVLAVVALIAGLLAPLALVAPLLLAIPLFGIGAAAIALRQISASEGAMIGRAVALVGLAFSIAMIGAVFTRTELSRTLLSSQARETGAEWFARLQSGDAEGAFRLTRDSLRPTPPPDDPASAPKPYDLFRAQPVVDFLLAHGDHVHVHYDGDVEPGDGPFDQYQVVQQYTLEDSHHGEPILVNLVLQRSKLDNELRWIVMNFESDQLKAPEAEHAHDHAHPHVH